MDSNALSALHSISTMDSVDVVIDSVLEAILVSVEHTVAPPSPPDATTMYRVLTLLHNTNALDIKTALTLSTASKDACAILTHPLALAEMLARDTSLPLLEIARLSGSSSFTTTPTGARSFLKRLRDGDASIVSALLTNEATFRSIDTFKNLISYCMNFDPATIDIRVIGDIFYTIMQIAIDTNKQLSESAPGVHMKEQRCLRYAQFIFCVSKLLIFCIQNKTLFKEEIESARCRPRNELSNMVKKFFFDILKNTNLRLRKVAEDIPDQTIVSFYEATLTLNVKLCKAWYDYLCSRCDVFIGPKGGVFAIMPSRGRVYYRCP